MKTLTLIFIAVVIVFFLLVVYVVQFLVKNSDYEYEEEETNS